MNVNIHMATTSHDLNITITPKGFSVFISKLSPKPLANTDLLFVAYSSVF